MPTLIKTVDGRDIIYTSNTGYTVTVGRYQVTPSPGVRLRDIDPQLEELTRDTEVSIATFAQDPTTGAVTGLVGPDGEEVNFPEPLEPTVIADWVSLAATGAVCGSPCLINRIRCVTGSAVTLTVYDNAAASSGTVLYTGSLSAGQEASVTTPLRAINGVRAAFASGSFEFQIQQEAA